MPKIRTLLVLGTRPEAIKMAPVADALRARPEIALRICSTGQHREMLRPLLEFFDMRPDIDLDLMSHAQTPAELAARALARLGPVLSEEKPDWVLVQGDTTTACAASLAAFYAGIRVGHVEAGLRTADKWLPFPEEMNRRLITRMAELHFAPTEQAAAALRAENVPESQIVITGNTVIDALFQTRQRIAAGDIALPPAMAAGSRYFVLMTMHRRENFDGGVAAVCDAVARFAGEHPDVTFLFPVHPNPAVKGPVGERLSNAPNVRLTDPLPYPELVSALDRADAVLTDSGGIQEEASALGKPVIVMRTDTERPEAVRNGNAVLVGSDSRKISENLAAVLFDADHRARMQRPCIAYGDGSAGMRIAAALVAVSQRSAAS